MKKIKNTILIIVIIICVAMAVPLLISFTNNNFSSNDTPIEELPNTPEQPEVPEIKELLVDKEIVYEETEYSFSIHVLNVYTTEYIDCVQIRADNKVITIDTFCFINNDNYLTTCLNQNVFNYIGNDFKGKIQVCLVYQNDKVYVLDEKEIYVKAKENPDSIINFNVGWLK